MTGVSGHGKRDFLAPFYGLSTYVFAITLRDELNLAPIILSASLGKEQAIHDYWMGFLGPHDLLATDGLRGDRLGVE